MSDQQSTKANATLIRLPILLGFIGYSLFWAWGMLLLGTSIYDRFEEADSLMPLFWLACRILFCFGAFTVYLTVKNSSWVIKKTRVLIVVIGLLPFSLIATHGLHEYAYLIAWLFSGFVFGMGTLIWSQFFLQLRNTQVKPFLMLSFTCSGFLVLIVLLLKPLAAFWVIPGIPAISLFLFAFVLYRYPSARPSLISEDDIQKTKKSYSIQSLACVSAGCCFLAYVLAVGPLSISNSSGESIDEIVMVALISCGALSYFDYRNKHIFNESFILKALLIVSVFIVVPMTLVDNPIVVLVLCCIAIPVLMISMFQGVFGTIGNITTKNLNPISSYAYVRKFTACGFVLGFVIAWCSLNGMFFAEYSFIAATLLVVFFMVVSIMFTGLVSRSPIEEKGLSKDDSYAIARADDSIKDKGQWVKLCQEIATSSKLSTRETEIFILYAKGQGIMQIAEELFISKATVRTHIHNIYRKLDVHSKGEVIALIKHERDSVHTNIS